MHYSAVPLLYGTFTIILFPVNQIQSLANSQISLCIAPLFEAVEYEEVNWTNDFDQPSIYRGYPNPEREKAWENLWRRLSPTISFLLFTLP